MTILTSTTDPTPPDDPTDPAPSPDDTPSRSYDGPSFALRSALRDRADPVSAPDRDKRDELDDDSFAGLDPDPTLDPDASDPPSARARPGHLVMDRSDITAALRASGYDGDFGCLSSGEEQRVRTLLQYRDLDRWRPHLIGTPAMLVRLDELDRAQANFAEVTQLIRRAVTVSIVSNSPLRIPALLMVGAPGIGKSRYVRALAKMLAVDTEIINGSTIPDTGSLLGYPPVWRGSGPGRIIRKLMTSQTTSPLFFIDECEKIFDFETMRFPLDRMLGLLEPTTAAAFQDECLQVAARAQYCIFLFACNALEGLSEPFLDRVVVCRIAELADEEREDVLEAMLAEVAAGLGLAISLASRAALAPLAPLGLRRCRLAFEIAVGRAVAAERRFLTKGDVAAAVALLSRRNARPAIGYGIQPRE